MPELNVELVKRVRQHIFDHPENFLMASWCSGLGDQVVTEETLCHTKACLAGTAIALVAADRRVTFGDVVVEYGRVDCHCGDPDCNSVDVGVAGQDLLGLDEDTANKLFYGKWPARYRSQGRWAEWQGAVDLLDDLAAGKPVL